MSEQADFKLAAWFQRHIFFDVYSSAIHSISIDQRMRGT